MLLVTYSGLVVLASLIGGWLPLVFRLSHARLQILMSLVSGLMLGVALFHLLPHAAAQLDSLDQAVGWTMAGLLGMLFLMRGFHSHQHMADPRESPACSHDHHHTGRAGPNIGWLGITAGLSLHTLIDGGALAAAVLAETSSDQDAPLAGLATFLAIVLHKPLDALSITTLMTATGWSLKLRQAVNVGFSLMCPLGAGILYFGATHLDHDHTYLVGAALGIATGVFLCIALGDLLPEIEFHSHDRLKLSAALLLGVAMAIAIGYLEPHGHHGTHDHAVHHDHE